MIITARKFGLQPANDLEVMALRNAIDASIDHDATPHTAELSRVRAQLGGVDGWLLVTTPGPQFGEFAVVELSAAALQLVSSGLGIFAEWADEPDYQPTSPELTSTQLRELAGTIDAWLVTA